MKPQLQTTFDANLSRVQSLVTVYEQLAGPGKGRRSVHAADTLRAAVVLLHATLEDFLRSVEVWKTPNAPPQVLDSFVLPGMKTGEKLTLGKLAPFRGKSVDDVFQEAVKAHLERKSYNNPKEISAMLDRVGLQGASFQSHFSSLDQLLQRRHHIVHRADRDGSPGTGHHHARSISKNQVDRWIQSVQSFANDVLNQL